MSLYLGIDIGTSAVKALVVDGDERLLAEAEIALALSRPEPGWAEQDPDAWWQATCEAIASLRATLGARLSDVAAIGLSGQMHGAVLLGSDDRPLAPAILWNDGRSVAECNELNIGISGLAEATGVPAMPGFLLPKLLWLARHRADLHARIAHVVLPKDYVRLKLTGTFATDMCDAAGALLLDEARRDWWQPALDAVGLHREQLPRLLEGTDVSGNLTGSAAATLGLPAGIPVAAGGGDAAAGAVGIGSVNDGDSFISLGTSSQVFVTTARYAPNPAALVHAFAHALPGRWFQMGAMLNGASALAWFAQAIKAPIPELLAEVEAAAKPVSPVTFLPYLQGERTPHNDADARGVLFGMDGGAARADLVQAVLEGVAFTLLDAQNALAVAGTSATHYAFIGGGARSLLWAEIIASALDKPLQLLKGGAKGPAFGAARLARIALTGEDVATVCLRPDVEAEILPAPDRRAALAERYPLFRRLYSALKPVY
ncbi:MAG: xylulokinase, partial [Ancalomicrobiaceae bacterium]|nr:xylulokinase [Ancalomicrobiaceae bacterium]